MLVFVTATAYAADGVQGLAGADSRCQEEAEAHGMSGTYRAWIGVGDDAPATTFDKSDDPYVRPDGEEIATSYAALVTDLPSVPISLTIDGEEPPVSVTCPQGVWTNVQSDGQAIAASACNEFSDANAGETAKTGTWDQTDATWTEGCADLCTAAHPLYCFQQP